MAAAWLGLGLVCVCILSLLLLHVSTPPHTHTHYTHTHTRIMPTQAKDPQRIADILTAAQERARLRARTPGSSPLFDPDDPKSEFVQVCVRERDDLI